MKTTEQLKRSALLALLILFGLQQANAQTLSPGDKVPDGLFPDYEGKEVQITSLNQKYLLIDFWASWCGPCKKHMPKLKALYQEFTGTEFEVVSISIDESHKAWIKALNNYNLPWINLKAKPNQIDRVLDGFQVVAVPTTYLIDQSRKVILVDPEIEVLRSFLKKNL